MKVFVAEKKSVALALAEALGTPMPGDGFYRSGEDIVVWAQGHLFGPAAPEKYKKEWKKWRKGDLPLLPDVFQIEPLRGQRKQIARIRTVLRQADQIVNACDAGREGELIFAWILDGEKQSVQKKYTKRLWVSSLTKESLRKGLSDLRSSGEFVALQDAARARAEADWLLGINATRAASLALGEGTVSLGRVQTPTLALLAERQEAHENFQPEIFWKVKVAFEGGLRGEHREGRISQERAQEIQKAIRKKGTVVSFISTIVVEKPPLLYDLTSLQREASSSWGWSAAQTLEVAQSLYERGILSYPRTDSRYLPTSMKPEDFKSFLPEFPMRSDWDRVFRDDLLGDHHAIVPVGDIGAASRDEQKLYKKVLVRLREALSLDAHFAREEIHVDCSGEIFICRVRRYKQWGWKPPEDTPPAVSRGDVLQIKKIQATESSTKAPSLHSDGTLLAAMEAAGKDLDDEEAREAMKDRGLGTPATRAAIIERLLEAGYIQRKGKSLLVTEKGMHLVGLLRGRKILRADLTGDWERDLRKIEQGADPEDFRRRLREFVVEETNDLLDLQPQAGEWGTCPSCKKPLRENKKAISCWTSEDPGCGFAVWKKVAGKRISRKDLRDLLQSGSTGMIHGFRSRSGEFSARLHLAQKEGSWKVVFD